MGRNFSCKISERERKIRGQTFLQARDFYFLLLRSPARARRGHHLLSSNSAGLVRRKRKRGGVPKNRSARWVPVSWVSRARLRELGFREFILSLLVR